MVLQSSQDIEVLANSLYKLKFFIDCSHEECLHCMGPSRVSRVSESI